MFKRLVVCVLLWASVGAWAAETLHVSMLVINGKHRDALRVLTKRFEAEHPAIQVELIEKPNDDYHRWMESWETSGADVIWWFAGYQLNQFASLGRIEPITELWQQQKMDQSFPGLRRAVSSNGEVYALPLSYYQWGFYYKKTVFQALNLSEPRTWEEFLAVCARLKNAGVTPLGLSTKASWPVASWFSYLDLRINGLEFHQQLMAGKFSFKDRRVKAVLREWKRLIDLGYFQGDSGERDWKGVLPFMYRDQVAMYLIGNFVLPAINKPLSEFGFFSFPGVRREVPVYEEAPTDVLFINRLSEHKEAARKFLAFMAQADNQFLFNEASGFITPNINAPKSDNEFVSKGFAILGAAKGVSQYFDRDTSKAMATAGFEILGEFAVRSDVERATNALEAARIKYLRP